MFWSSPAQPANPHVLSAEEAVACLFEAAAKGGHPGAVHKLVTQYKVDLSSRNPDGLTALHVAVQNNRVDTARALLRAQSPLVDSKLHGTAVEMALADPVRHAEILQVFSAEMLQQIGLGNVERLGQLIDAGVSPNSRDGTKENGSLLHWVSSAISQYG